MDALLASAWGPLVIFCLRIVDVSLATLRMLLSVRGVKLAAPLIGFFEILIWLTAVGTAIQHLDSPLHLIGYAAGFSMGTLVGLTIEERMAIGMAALRVVSRHGGVELAEAMRDLGFGVTEYTGHGREGAAEVGDARVARRGGDRLRGPERVRHDPGAARDSARVVAADAAEVGGLGDWGEVRRGNGGADKGTGMTAGGGGVGREDAGMTRRSQGTTRGS